MKAPGAQLLEPVRAITKRDFEIELSYHFQLLLRLTQVVFLSMSLYYVSKLVGDPVELEKYGGDYFEFALTGMIVLSFAGLGLATFSRSVADEQKTGTLEVLLSSPARPGVLLAGALVVPLAMTGIQIVTYLAVAIVFFGAHFPLDGTLLALPVLFVTGLTFCAFGIFSAAFIILTKRGDPLTAVGAQITTFFAGTLFPVSLLPGPVQFLTRLVPAYYGLEGVRAAMLGHASVADVAGDLLVIGGFAAVLLPLSLAAFSWALSTARTVGTLGNY
jgi:ABC-2 type transport system permease protein